MEDDEHDYEEEVRSSDRTAHILIILTTSHCVNKSPFNRNTELCTHTNKPCQADNVSISLMDYKRAIS